MKIFSALQIKKRFFLRIASLLIFGGLLSVSSLFIYSPQAALAITSLYAQPKTVNIYSYRQEFLIRPLLDDFTQKTGIRTRVVYLSSGMLERLKSEGRNSPADVVLTVDVGRFKNLSEGNVLGTLPSKITRKIPSQYRDPQNAWIALTTRARVIYASKDRVPEDPKLTYASLAEPQWKGKICTRSGYHPYNIALIASQIAHYGNQATETWLRGLKANLARRPQGNDRAQVKAIKEGLCDLSIGNSYYYGKMALNDKNPEQKEWANAVRLIFPNQDSEGTHMNVSGAAITRYAPNKANALDFIQYLTSDEAQFIYAEENFEFPVSPNAQRPSKLPALTTSFKEDTLPLSEIMEYYTEATLLVDRVRYDH